MKGRIYSFQSLGTLDGPACGLWPFCREVRCGAEYDAEDVVRYTLRCRAYFGRDSGMTLFGGDPLRQVIIPTLNATLDNVLALLAIARRHPCVERVELLLFRKNCQTKYDAMNLVFPFGHLPESKHEQMENLKKLLGSYGE